MAFEDAILKTHFGCTQLRVSDRYVQRHLDKLLHYLPCGIGWIFQMVHDDGPSACLKGSHRCQVAIVELQTCSA